MSTLTNKQLAKSMNISEEVLPYFHELLADIWILGSFPHRIAEALKPLVSSTNRPRILDLGCGKGAVAVTLAKELVARVDGYDQYKPFLDEAIQKAKEQGVSDLCRFELANIEDIVLTARDYDVVTLASVGPVDGNLEHTVGQLRQTVHQGGFILINDCFSIEGQIDFQGYGYVATHDEYTRQLTSHGDRLVKEVIVPKEEVIAHNQFNNEAIEKRAAELTKRFPDEAQIFADFVQREKDECEVIETCTDEAIWLLQRA